MAHKTSGKRGSMGEPTRPLGEAEPSAPRGVGGVEPDGPAQNGDAMQHPQYRPLPDFEAAP